MRILKLLTFILPILIVESISAQGTALEEVVVTAQRRTQSLQEVPISVEVFTGAEIDRQGFRDMNDLASFDPTLNVSPDFQNQVVMIRGVGTQGSNFSFEQAAPTFVDGIHFGRTSQIKSAFLDIERIEILRGPQPIFFGQNATAGALSITTKKPGPEWEGKIIAEYGHTNTTRMLEFGVGGPVTDTWGVRIAGKYDATEGHMIDILTRDRYPARETLSGRAILQWVPNDTFDATFKFDISDSSSDGRGLHYHLSGEGTPNPLNGDSVLVTGGLKGVNMLPLSNDFDRQGMRKGPQYVKIPEDNPVFDSRRSSRRQSYNLLPLANTLEIGKRTGTEAGEDLEPWNTYLNMNYRLANDIELSSQTGYSRYVRNYLQHFDSGGPFLMNPLTRSEDFHQWSQEFRATSPSGGTFEWMVGGYYQNNALNTTSNSWENNAARQLRANESSDDAEWLSAFATVTYNFFGDKASLDVGGRFSDVQKFGKAQFFVGKWILEDPVTGEPTMVPSSFLDPGVPVPAAFAPGTEINIIGHTDLVPFEDPSIGEFSATEFDPQIVLRYRPTQNLSVYAKWSQAFKAGGFDVGVTGLGPQEDFEFDSEYAENWEAGAKTTFWDGRGNFDLTLFRVTFDDLQVSASDPVRDRNRTQNIGAQRTTGAEFRSRLLVSDQLTMGLSGSILDGKVLSFLGANCTQAEADTGLCWDAAKSIEEVGHPNLAGTIDRSGQKAIRSPDWNFVFTLDYWMPVLNDHKVSFNGKFKYSDGFILSDRFDKTVMMDTYADVNLSLGFGDRDNTWEIAAWGRNLTDPLPEYFPEFDINPDGLVSTDLHPNDFKSFGLQLRYNY